MAEYITHANQGATRNQPISQELAQAMSFLPELGVTMEVFSGGQPSAQQGGGRVGSVRHDHGGAADVFFYQNGRRLDWADPNDRPIFEQIVGRGRAAGLTGFGAGDNYMQPGSMHIGFGNEAVWGEGGRSANAPEWLRNAYYGAPSGPSGQQPPAQGQQGPSQGQQQQPPMQNALAPMPQQQQPPQAPQFRNAMSAEAFMNQPQQNALQPFGFTPGTSPFLLG